MPRSYKIHAIGRPQSRVDDLYYATMSVSWGVYSLLVLGSFVAINLVFAVIYQFLATHFNGHDHLFLTSFSFSVQTLTTIGYGHISPATGLAHVLISIEAFVGLFYTAIVTGVTFAKFARPKGKILFSKHMLWQEVQGKTGLVIRIANGRSSRIWHAKVKCLVLLDSSDSNGKSMRKLVDLKLKRSETPILGLSLTITHDLSSGALKNYDLSTLRKMNAEFLFTVEGIDEAIGLPIYDHFFYHLDDIMVNHRFKDIISVDNPMERTINLHDFHVTQELEDVEIPIEKNDNSGDSRA